MSAETPVRTVHIFVSSTWLDLQPERAAVETALQRLRETKFVGMEYFGSRGEDTRHTSLDEVDRSHVYVGILGGRYGSGTRQKKGKGKHVTKMGDVYLRRALNNLVETFSLHQPTLSDYRRRLKGVKPHPGVARVATIREATGILFAIQRDQRIDGLLVKPQEE